MENKYELNEKKLKALFDYQHFENNERLEKLICETESRYAKELSDDDLSLVSAAGEFTMPGGTIGTNPAETDNWYGVENQNHTFEPGSRFWVNRPVGSNMPKEIQVGGLVGDPAKGGTVSGYNIGRITGDFISNYSENNESK